MDQRDKDRFWNKVDVSSLDVCWNWKASKVFGGYGRMGIDSHLYLAHRISWEIQNGNIPEGMMVLHKCDNPACCNPTHLFLGTQETNIRDMVSKNRQVNGEGVRRSKLSSKSVIKIRALLKLGKSTTELGKLFNVNRATISKVGSRKLWNWVD